MFKKFVVKRTRKRPQPLAFAKHLHNVVGCADVVQVVAGAVAVFDGALVAAQQRRVVGEQEANRDAKRQRHDASGQLQHRRQHCALHFARLVAQRVERKSGRRQNERCRVGVGERVSDDARALSKCAKLRAQRTKHAQQKAIEQEEIKIFVVEEAAAVVDPRTVVVHFQYARATRATVM